MKKITIIIILFLSIALIGCENKKEKVSENKVVKTISIDEVKEIIDNHDEYKKIQIIDVRTKEEYNESHLKGAKNIPLDNIKDINISKDTEIIVYCRSGARSREAANILISLGYKNINDMGGIINWEYDLVSG